jgi:hypothetical protein
MQNEKLLEDRMKLYLDLLTTIMIRLAFWGGVFYQMYRAADSPLAMFLWLAIPVLTMYGVNLLLRKLEPGAPRRVVSAGADE